MGFGELLQNYALHWLIPKVYREFMNSNLMIPVPLMSASIQFYSSHWLNDVCAPQIEASTLFAHWPYWASQM